MHFEYPARLLQAPEGGFDVTFRDFPDAFTCGDDRAEALAMAADCLAEAVAGRMNRKEAVPHPSRLQRGEVLVAIPALIAAKAALHGVIHESGLSVLAFAREHGLQETTVRRMLNPRHQTPIRKIQELLDQLGKRLVIQVEDAA